MNNDSVTDVELSAICYDYVYIDVYEGDSSTIPYMLIYGRANGRTLRSQHPAWNDMIKFSLQITSVVRYLHVKGIVNLGLVGFGV
ncbi:4158_t:CDS:2 [Gigaspora margarita]|uniref:4158_t:CDS:1 n=1 Tax=Gigaspora margarita TaxID=4874 RepID=A0ABN7UE21_GIGMA|nr:4158_t:CDS:2 [Gigaspora margarita]